MAGKEHSITGEDDRCPQAVVAEEELLFCPRHDHIIAIYYHHQLLWW